MKKYNKSTDQKIKELQEQVDFLKKQAAPKMGRPTLFNSVEIARLERACSLQMKQEDIAYLLGVSRPALEKFVKRNFGKTFYEYRKEKAYRVVFMIKDKQLQVALKGSERMLIHLDERYCGYIPRQNNLIGNVESSKLIITMDQESPVKIEQES